MGRGSLSGALGFQLEQERARRGRQHAVLVSALRNILRPRSGGKVVVTTLRRLLRLAGLDPTVVELSAAVMDIGGRYARMAPSKAQRDWRRAFVGVEVLPSRITAVAPMLADRWEDRLAREGLTPEPKRLEDVTEHFAVRAEIAAGVQDSLSTYLELRAAEISTADRRLISLYLEGLSEREIAARVGCPHRTVHDRLTRHRHRAGLGVKPGLLRARKYLVDHDWSADPVPERAIWERFAQGDGYRTIAKALGLGWQEVVGVLHRHRLRAGMDLG